MEVDLIQLMFQHNNNKTSFFHFNYFNLGTSFFIKNKILGSSEN